MASVHRGLELCIISVANRAWRLMKRFAIEHTLSFVARRHAWLSVRVGVDPRWVGSMAVLQFPTRPVTWSSTWFGTMSDSA